MMAQEEKPKFTMAVNNMQDSSGHFTLNHVSFVVVETISSTEGYFQYALKLSLLVFPAFAHHLIFILSSNPRKGVWCSVLSGTGITSNLQPNFACSLSCVSSFILSNCLSDSDFRLMTVPGPLEVSGWCFTSICCCFRSRPLGPLSKWANSLPLPKTSSVWTKLQFNPEQNLA